MLRVRKGNHDQADRVLTKVLAIAACVGGWSLATSSYAMEHFDRSKYIELHPGEQLVIKFGALHPDPTLRPGGAGALVHVAMDSAYRLVVFPPAASGGERLSLDQAEFEQLEPELPSVTARVYENAGDASPYLEETFEPDGAGGIWTVLMTDTLWKDAEGMVVIAPIDAVFRVYGYNLARVDRSMPYTTGYLGVSTDDAAGGDAAATVQGRATDISLATGSIVGLACGPAGPGASSRARLSFVAIPGRRYQLETCSDLRDPVWRASGEPRRALAAVLQVELAFDCDAAFYRIVELGP